jgi:hypothetical protein
MSKMQMLLFAVGIAVVALMFYDFVSRVGLVNSAKDLVLSDTKLVDEQLSNDLLCSFKVTNIPDALTYGFNSQRFFYDLGFSSQTVGTGENVKNTLIVSVSEHKKTTAQKNVVYAKDISSDAKFVLIDSNFLLEGSGLEKSYDKTDIALYPRAASVREVAASSPNSFVALKEVKSGEKSLYIIPCSTLKEPNNCLRNILRVGCYQLKQTTPKDTDLVPSCFNISVEVSEDSDTRKNYTWANCKNFFPEITSSSS